MVVKGIELAEFRIHIHASVSKSIAELIFEHVHDGHPSLTVLHQKNSV